MHIQAVGKKMKFRDVWWVSIDHEHRGIHEVCSPQISNLWWLPALSPLPKKLLSLAFEHHFGDPMCFQLCVCLQESTGWIPQGEAGAGAVCVKAARPLHSWTRSLFTQYFVERNKMVGDAFCCYLMGSWECNRPQHLIWILHQIITGFCYLPHPVFLISISTCLFCCLPQQHCTLQYQNTLIPGIVLLSVFLSFLWGFFPFSTILFQQSHSAAWDEASPLYITSQPWYHVWLIFCLSAIYDTQQQSLFQVFKRRHQ